MCSFSTRPDSERMNTVDKGGVELERRTQKRLSRKAGVMVILEASSGLSSDISFSSEKRFLSMVFCCWREAAGTKSSSPGERAAVR